MEKDVQLMNIELAARAITHSESKSTARADIPSNAPLASVGDQNV
jgi:hypothetical protein